MELRDQLEAHKELITDRLDPDFGLLNELLTNRSLTRPEVARVKAVPDSYGRSEKLLEYIFDKGTCEQFLDALRKTQQTHLVNFIISSGDRRPEFGDDWPLTEREMSILDNNQRSLVDLLDSPELLLHLYSHEVISNRQRDFVSTKTASHEKNDALLDILRRTSLGSYKKTIFCLQTTKQNHIADLLTEGGAVVRVRSELETESDVNLVEDELITKITELLGDRTLGDSARILECSQLRLIAAKRGNSVILYFICKTMTEFVHLKEMQISGKLENVVGDMFHEILSSAQIINLKISLYDEDFSKCELEFRRVGAKCVLDESCDEDDGSAASNAPEVFDQEKAEDTPKEAEDQLREITECPICMSVFTDPRMLPCIHTFCFQCLKRTLEATQKLPGDKMPCPFCRKEFIIPRDGVNGVQKNFFMNNLLAAKAAMQTGKSCTKHIHKPLDHYCAQCKKTVCIFCFFESHKLHDCKGVTEVDKEFRQTIENKALKISTNVNELLLMKTNNDKRKSDLFKEIDETEKEIHDRNQELKDMIDRHTRLLLDELAVIKSKHLKEIDNQIEEIERYRTVLGRFEAYCRELALNGSASDICSSFDELIVRADELEREQKAFIGRLHQSIKVSFQATDLEYVFPNTYINFVGDIEETNAEYENFALIVGIHDGKTVTRDVVKINLNQPNEITTEEQVPSRIDAEAFAAVCKNTTYVAGLGIRRDEIWKYKKSVGWKQCASLVEGRSKHCAAFIDEVLYICGGFVFSTKLVLDSVEAFNAITNKCTAVGKLVHAVKSTGNCVPFKSSLYIFGGADEDLIAFNHVQVYNTKDNTCSVLSRPMPLPYYLIRVILWETSAILIENNTCFIFNIETETWQERKQFKSDVVHFGLVLENGRLFVIGGGLSEKDKNGKGVWRCRDDVRYVPLQNIIDNKPIEWKIHGNLSKPCLVHAYANIRQLRPQST